MDQDLISDVAIVANESYLNAQQQAREERPPLSNRFDLSNELWVGRLSPSDFERIRDGCIEPGYEYHPERVIYQLYTFVRENPPREHKLKWDLDGCLVTCLALSRVVHPTSVSPRYAARIFRDGQGNLEMAVPARVAGPGATAYVSSPDNDWLTVNDAQELRDLLAAYRKNPLRDSLHRALWYHEYAARIYELDVRWTLVATGLESLIHTDRYGSTAQFVKRLPKLAARVNAPAIHESEASQMYDCRSSLSHGQGVFSLSHQDIPLYDKMEHVLRQTIRKAILDPSVASFLGDPTQIRANWPA